MKTTAINSESAPGAVGGYNQAILIEGAQRLLFISGQIPETTDGRVPTDFESQCRLTWANVLAQLDAAGMSVANLTKVTIFLSSREYAEPNSKIRREFLEGATIRHLQLSLREYSMRSGFSRSKQLQRHNKGAEIRMRIGPAPQEG